MKSQQVRCTHKELKQQVVVWILVLEADGALFLQVDGVDERHRALVPVGLQVVSLRHPGGAGKQKSVQVPAGDICHDLKVINMHAYEYMNKSVYLQYNKGNLVLLSRKVLIYI